MASKQEEIKALVTLFAKLTKNVKEAGDALQKTLESKREPKTLSDIKKTEDAIDKLNE